MKCRAPQQPTSRRRLTHRSAFTLIELLVVLTIALILMAMTAATFNYVRESDRVSSEASKVQSYLLGARDRAIYNDEMRGVRLFVEPAPPGSPPGASAFSRTVTAMAYIAPGGTWNSPEHSAPIDLLRQDLTGAAGGGPDGDFDDDGDLLRIVRGKNNPGWWNLKRRGWLVDGLRMRIPAGPTGHWYTINTSLIDVTSPPTSDQILLLDVPYADGGNTGQEIAWENLTYEIELPPRVLPQEPNLLADSVVIDLDGSDIPNIWRPASTGNALYSGYMDIWFSPRGNLIGEAAAKGILHFYVCDAEDSLFLKEQMVTAVGLGTFDAVVASGTPFIPMDEIDQTSVGWLTGTDTYIVKDRRIVTLFSQTGGVTVNRINSYTGLLAGTAPDIFDPFDSDGDSYLGPAAAGDPPEPDGLADDPFRFAETGEVAK